ncbi:uncharacterized protein LOC135399707 [Ornithodoros turicata]|uniref:uncharacterized protein LOC135399707 n=1 Tax=Ornithodoros turicata TaxID=34597 RepID=UPI003139BB9C
MPCAVPGCVNKGSTSTNRLLHRIPKNEPARGTWLKLIGRHDVPPGVGLKICHLHFTPDDYVRNISLARSLGVNFDAVLKRGVTPSLNLPGATSQSSKRRKTEDRRAAASTSADSKPRVTQPYSEEVLQTVPKTAVEHDTPSVPAVHSMEMSTFAKQQSAQALQEQHLMRQDIPASNEEAHDKTVDKSVIPECPMRADAAIQTMSIKYDTEGTQVDFCVKSRRETGVQVNLVDNPHPPPSPIRC